MPKRSVIWLVGVVLIPVGCAYGWHAWVEWYTTMPPAVAVLKPAVPNLDAPCEMEVERTGDRRGG